MKPVPDPERYVGWAFAGVIWRIVCKRATYDDYWDDLLGYATAGGHPVKDRMVKVAGVHPIRTRVRDYPPRRGKR